jgi:hypothetical protein
MTQSDTTIDYKTRSFLYLYINFFVSKCKSIKVELSVRRQPDSDALKRPQLIHPECDRGQWAFDGKLDKLSNRSGPTSISYRQGLQIIETFYRYFCRVLRHRRGLVIYTWDPGPSWSMSQEDEEHLRDV